MEVYINGDVEVRLEKSCYEGTFVLNVLVGYV